MILIAIDDNLWFSAGLLHFVNIVEIIEIVVAVKIIKFKHLSIKK